MSGLPGAGGSTHLSAYIKVSGGFLRGMWGCVGRYTVWGLGFGVVKTMIAFWVFYGALTIWGRIIRGTSKSHIFQALNPLGGAGC